MSLPRFDYVAASSIEEACGLAGPGSLFVAGGTDLLVAMKQRLREPVRLIGLSTVPELRGIARACDGSVRMGAATTLTELAEWARSHGEWAGLGEVVRRTASPLVRNAGTVGGNLCLDTRCTFYNQPAIFRERWGPCLKLGGSACHAVRRSETCHAVYSGDLAGPLMALGASATIAGAEGARTVAITDLFSADAVNPIALAPHELVVDISLPAPRGGFRFSYQKSRLRDTIDYPLVGVSLFIGFDEDSGPRIGRARVVLTAAGPAPVNVSEGGALLEGRVWTADLADEVGESLGVALSRHATFVGNAAAGATYRKRMIPVLARRALRSMLAHPDDGGDGV